MPAKKTYIAFIRAVNVGGTGKLPMATLKDMCKAIGFTDVQTYIASGNLVFTSGDSKKQVTEALETELRDYASKEVGVIIRTATELKKVLEKNPFADKKPNHTVVLFLDKKPLDNVFDQITGQADEELVLGGREIYIHYGSGMGSSKLKLPAQKIGTARNINTVTKMIELSS